MTETARKSLPWLAVLLTSLVIAVYSPTQYMTDTLAALAQRGTGLASTYAERPAVIQIVFYVHIVFAGLALLIGGFQFSRRLRRRAPRLHRWIGRTYVVSILVGGVAAFVMSFFSSVALLGFFGFGTLAVLWIWTTYRGYQSARAGDFAAHQAWMIRSFALTYAAPTLRMWLGLLLLVQLPFGVDGAQAAINAYAPVPFLCWLPNLVIAEYLVYRRGLPGLDLGALKRPRPLVAAD
ncbi:hypothetical protein BH10ACT9_BH10ACT9_55840 [soil metagenome]